MNATAEKLGMKKSTFVNASGWPVKGQSTTARDIAVLTNALEHDFIEYATMFTATQARHSTVTRGRSQTVVAGPHDHVRDDPLIKAQMNEGLTLGIIKTGYIDASRFNIAISATLPNNVAEPLAGPYRGRQELVAVVLGAESDELRATTTKQLFSQAIERWAPMMRNVLTGTKNKDFRAAKIPTRPHRSLRTPAMAESSPTTSG